MRLLRRSPLLHAVRLVAAAAMVLSTIPLSVLAPPGSPITPRAAEAATIGVTTPSDIVDAGACAGLTITSLPGTDGFVSLREAVCVANNTPGADVITLPAGPYTLTVAPDASPNDAADGDLDITESVTINGAGAASTFIQACDVAANAACVGIDRLFDIIGSVSLSISGVTLRKGKTPGGAGANSGGAIQNAAGTLSLTDVTLTGNSANFEGGAVANSSGSTFNLTNGTITNNSAGSTAGGSRIWAQPPLVGARSATTLRQTTAGPFTRSGPAP